jgi:hypothetical protein
MSTHYQRVTVALQTLRINGARFLLNKLDKMTLAFYFDMLAIGHWRNVLKVF